MSSDACNVVRGKKRLHVIIVGGGIAGLDVAKEFEKTDEFNVTIISNKDFTEYTPLTGTTPTSHSLCLSHGCVMIWGW
jgi:NADH dehydrogenase FAD-containing subunit